jgi:hypothetical protein
LFGPDFRRRVAPATSTEIRAGRPGGAAGNFRAALLIGAGWSALAAFDLWLLLLRPDAAWDTRIAFVLGLVGVYTFAFGLLSATDLLKRLQIGPSLTSPNPVIFLAGNFAAMSLLYSTLSIALAPQRTGDSLDRRGGMLLEVARTPLLIAGCLLAVAFSIVYLVLIAPLAWLAYVAVSVPLDSVLTSGRDMELTMTSAGEDATVRIKELFQEHLVTFRNLLVAVPSLLSSLILGAPNLI